MHLSGEVQSLVQAANMYYKEHLNQQEIAVRMGVTRQTVARLLRKAEEEGIIEFRIHNPLEILQDLSERLAHRFSLAHALVVPCKFQEQDMVTAVLAQYAGQYVTELIEKGAENVGISWGRTVYHTILNLSSADCSGTTFFPLVGASNQTAEYFMINEMVRRAADMLNAVPVYTYIPADPASKEDAALFKRTSTYETIASYWSRIDLAIMGVGANPMLDRGRRDTYPGEQYVLNAAIDDAVGDLLTHYFDADGRFVHLDDSEILCASIDNLRACRHVLAIAGGSEKVMSIRAALKTGIITDLVTDQQTCSCLLRLK